MSRSPVHSFLASALAAGLALGVASPALAYVVVLKGGKRHIAIDKPVELDNRMTFVEKGSRAQFTVAVADVDLERTKEANSGGTGDAYALSSDGTTKALKQPVSSRPSLNDRVQRLKKTPRAVSKTTSEEPPSEGTASPSLKAKPASKKKGPTPTPPAPTPTPTNPPNE